MDDTAFRFVVIGRGNEALKRNDDRIKTGDLSSFVSFDRSMEKLCYLVDDRRSILGIFGFAGQSAFPFLYN